MGAGGLGNSYHMVLDTNALGCVQVPPCEYPSPTSSPVPLRRYRRLSVPGWWLLVQSSPRPWHPYQRSSLDARKVGETFFFFFFFFFPRDFSV